MLPSKFVKPLPFSPPSLLFSPAPPSAPNSMSLGVWERWRRGVHQVAPAIGHGRPQRGVVRGGVPHLPLAHLQQPGDVLLVRGGRHFQPLPDQPETNQGHPQQPADQSHLPHTGAVENHKTHFDMNKYTNPPWCFVFIIIKLPATPVYK